MDWKKNIIDTDDELRELLKATGTVAVIGIKMEEDKPAYYVPKYMQDAGCEVIPVPVFYPEATEIMGEKIYRSLSEILGEVDMVNIFRKPSDVPIHLEDILAKKPKSVWMQSGIRNDEVAEALAKAGIKVVQDKCLMVEHRALIRRQ
jgi:predicted CoA-binding protein